MANVGWFSAKKFCCGGVSGDGIGGDDQRLHLDNIGRRNPARAILFHDVIGINHCECRPAIRSEIGDALMQVVAVPEAAIPHHTHQVFHTNGDHRRAVML